VLRRELTDAQKQFDAYVKSDVHALIPEISELMREAAAEPGEMAMHCIESSGRDCNAAAAVATERD